MYKEWEAAEVELEPTVYEIYEEMVRLRDAAAAVGKVPQFGVDSEHDDPLDDGIIYLFPSKPGEPIYDLHKVPLDSETIDYIFRKYEGKPQPKYVPTRPDEMVGRWGNVVRRLTYEQAVVGILLYLEKAGSEGEVTITSLGDTEYEILKRGVYLADGRYTNFGFEDEYVSLADGERLVAAGLARPW